MYVGAPPHRLMSVVVVPLSEIRTTSRASRRVLVPMRKLSPVVEGPDVGYAGLKSQLKLRSKAGDTSE